MFDNFLKLSGNLAASGPFSYGFSEEHKIFYSSGYKCSQCSNTLLTKFGNLDVNIYSKDGTKINLILMLTHGEILECPHCNHRWKMRGTSNITKANKLEIVDVIETDRSEEILGIEKRLIDNSKSTSKTTRKFAISREWSKNYSIQYEKTQANGTEFNLTLKLSEAELGGIKLSSQETIKKQYSVFEGTKENYTEEVIVEVAESKKLNFIFSWKRIWQNGLIKLCSQDNTELYVPFRVVVGVTFDQFLVEET
jgi:hypothetical protein